MHQDVDESLLPGILQEMIALIGLAATLKLVRRYGGSRIIYVPKTLSPDHELVATIGWEAATILAKRFGGEDHLEIPKAQAFTIAVRNIKIRQEYPNLSQPKLALKYCLTERQIRNILYGDEQLVDNSQMGLF